MSENQKKRALSRRSAFRKLAEWPRALFTDREAVQLQEDSEEVLEQCMQGIATCWQISKGSDLSLAYQKLPLYLQRLEQLASHTTLPSQEDIAHIASQGYQLASILASHRGDLIAREVYARRGVDWAKTTGDSTLIVTALTRLGVTFHYTEQPLHSLWFYQEAFPLLHQASPLAQSSLSMKCAETYAQLGHEREAEQRLDLAYQSFPAQLEDDPAFLYADCDVPSLFLWDGMTHLALSRRGGVDHLDKDQLNQAWQAFEPFGGLHPSRIVSERNRLEILTHQAETTVHLRALDLFSDYLIEAATSAKALGSEKRRNEAIKVYWQARDVWPREGRIKELAELLI